MDDFEFSDILHGNILRNRCLCLFLCLCPNSCGRHYKKKGHMTYHLKFECGVCSQFKCPYCSKLFSQKSSFKTHIMCIHKVLFNSTLNISSNN